MAVSKKESVNTLYLSFVFISCFILALTFSTNTALAAKKKKKNKGILIENPDSLIAIQFDVKQGKKKTKTFNAHCYNNGKKIFNGLLTVDKVGRDRLKTFASLKKAQSKKGRKLRGKKAKKAKKLAKMYAKAAKAAKPLCLVPKSRDLDPYRGSFGAAEARILFDRFAFGASRAEVDRAVAEGLEASIARLTFYNLSSGFDDVTRDLRCEGVINAHDPENAEYCDPVEINDVDFRGVRYDIYFRMLHSPFPYFEKIFMFLHDRIAASSDVLSSCERYALPRHVDLLRKHARDGNYKQLVLDMVLDPLMLKWLDGALSVKGNANENFPREFWELFTIGTKDLNGTPLYQPIDIAESSRAFTGWTLDWTEIFEDYYACIPTYSPFLHDNGTKVIFRGTAHQTQVNSFQEVFNATFAHPSAAEELSKRMLKEFVTPSPSNELIIEFASKIRDVNFNIHEAAKILMRSNIMYSANTKDRLIKSPVDLLIGFLRATRIPVKFYTLDSVLEDMGMQVTQPDTVFGWYEDVLADEGYILEDDNGLIRILSDTSYLKDKNFSYRSFLREGITSQEAIQNLSSMLGVSLTPVQAAHIDQFMNYDLRSGELERRAFDADIEAEYIWWPKTAGALYLIASSWEYRMK